MTPERQAAAPVLADNAAKRALGHTRILTVEDNPINQEVVRCTLKKVGCNCETAATGPAALELVASRPYDLILMDCQMPGMDGYETTAAVRKLERSGGLPANGQERSRIPIVAMTANVLRGDREKCLAAGMDDYLSKPFRPEQLYDCLERWLPDTLEAVAERSRPVLSADSSAAISRPSSPIDAGGSRAGVRERESGSRGRGRLGFGELIRRCGRPVRVNMSRGEDSAENQIVIQFVMLPL